MGDSFARKLVEIFFLYFFRLFPVESILQFQLFSSVTLTPMPFFLDFLHALFFQVSVFSLWWFFCTDGASAHNLQFSIVKSHFVSVRWCFLVQSVIFKDDWLLVMKLQPLNEQPGLLIKQIKPSQRSPEHSQLPDHWSDCIKLIRDGGRYVLRKDFLCLLLFMEGDDPVVLLQFFHLTY